MNVHSFAASMRSTSGDLLIPAAGSTSNFARRIDHQIQQRFRVRQVLLGRLTGRADASKSVAAGLVQTDYGRACWWRRKRLRAFSAQQEGPQGISRPLGYGFREPLRLRSLPEGAQHQRPATYRRAHARLLAHARCNLLRRKLKGDNWYAHTQVCPKYIQVEL
jgi:hypothetical protein